MSSLVPVPGGGDQILGNWPRSTAHFSWKSGGEKMTKKDMTARLNQVVLLYGCFQDRDKILAARQNPRNIRPDGRLRKDVAERCGYSYLPLGKAKAQWLLRVTKYVVLFSCSVVFVFEGK